MISLMRIAIPSHLTDGALVAEVARLRGGELEVTARLIAHLAEVEVRALYVPAGYSSLFTYCHEGLGYSEDEAYNRKTAAQVARRYPAVVDMLADGRLSLTAVRLLAPVLKDDNWEATFAEAAGKRKREIEKLVARLDPRADVAAAVRKLPAPELTSSAVPERRPEGVAAVPRVPAARRAEAAPLAPDRYRVQFTIGEETEKKLRRLQQLLKREIPDGDPAVIFDRALSLLLDRVERRKQGRTTMPRTGRAGKPGSRHVPAATRRQVVTRDAGQCAFVAAGGRRCTERAYLEYHHAGVPYARGGGSGAENIALHCRRHNAFESERIFGRYLPPEIRAARGQYDAMRFAVPEREVSRGHGAESLCVGRTAAGGGEANSSTRAKQP
jgi:hypothetical protein